MINSKQRQQFFQDGYLVLPQFASAVEWQGIRSIALNHLNQRIEPLELESELQYPGAPKPNAKGHQTIRRLKQAYDRAPEIAAFATGYRMKTILSDLLPAAPYLVRSHHNCIMSKQPEYSSDSWWHQDIRYWSYQSGELISAWLALGPENSENGGLIMIPGSHQQKFTAEQFDSEKFFRQDLAKNKPFIEARRSLNLAAGDLVLFDCRTLHAATRNRTNQAKLAAVFTYRHKYDLPLANTRSAKLEDIRL